MPKDLIKRYTPDHETVKNHKHLRMFGKLLHDPNLWHLNRRSVSKAFATGLFWAMIPMPLQMVAAAFSSIVLRSNLPIAVALVWLSNPFTMPPMFYFNYLVGTWIVGAPPDLAEFHMTVEWISAKLGEIWLPLYLGSLVIGVMVAALGYGGIRWYWRTHVIKRYRKRLARRMRDSG